MSLLLDMHVLLWWLEDNPGLSQEARAAIGDGRQIVYVSAATAWEISIKKALGKLDAPDDLGAALSDSAFEALPITIAHATAAGQLPTRHSDPFDRMLVAQAKIENLTLVTRDSRMAQYPIATMLA